MVPQKNFQEWQDFKWKSRQWIFKILLRIQGYDNTREIALHPYNAICFTIPKIASSNLRKHFKKVLNIKTPDSISIHATKFPHVDREKLKTEYQHYFKFCFVRNPWDRLVSCYLQKVKYGTNINVPKYSKWIYKILSIFKLENSQVSFLKYPILTKEMSFREFVDAVAKIPDDKVDKHIRSQHKYITDEQGNLLVDFIGHLENIEEDFAKVCQIIGMQENKLSRRRGARTNKAENFILYYDQETWEIVKQRYQKDIEMLGYDDDFTSAMETVLEQKS